MHMAHAIQQLSTQIKGKQAIAVEAFAKALRALPTAIADNGGYDSADLIATLRSEVANGNLQAGIDMYNGKIGNMQELGVTECFRAKEQALVSASEAAELILRVDDIVKCAPRKRERM